MAKSEKGHSTISFYCSMPHNNISPKLSGFLDTLINQGISTGGQIVSTHLAANAAKPKGCGVSSLSRDGDIAACLDQLWAAFRAAERQYNAIGDFASTLQAALQTQAAINSNSYFKQTSNNAYLAQSKQVIADSVAMYENKLKEALVQVPASQAVNPITGQPQAVTTLSFSGAVNWIESHPVTGGAVAALIAYLIFKKS